MLNHSIRLYITEGCNANCPSCFNYLSRTQNSMSIDKFEQICQYFSENEIHRIKIMGGEPTTHPQFLEFMKIAQSYFPEVILFTNGINDEILKYDPRSLDSIVYNFTFHKLWSNEKLILDKPGRRAFEIQIRPNSNILEFKSWLKSKNIDRFVNVLTFDCTTDIFKDREGLIQIINDLQHFFNENGLSHSMDHRIPLCFLYKSGITVPTSNFSICNLSCSALIDSNYRLKFCNQYSNTEGFSIFYGNKILPYKLLENYLTSQFMHIQYENLNRICLGCVFYGDKCNGGCFLSRSSKESIIENTEFPIL